MQYEKNHIKRAIEEHCEGLTNILNAKRDKYALCIRLSFLTIKSNEGLGFIIKRNLDLQIYEGKADFIGTGNSRECDFVILENDNKEITEFISITIYWLRNAYV